MGKANNRRGCGVMLPSLVLLVGLSGCGYALLLAQFNGGETVSQSVGVSFWASVLCGPMLTAVGFIMFTIQRLIGVVAGLTGRFTGLDDAIPDLGFLDDFLRRG